MLNVERMNVYDPDYVGMRIMNVAPPRALYAETPGLMKNSTLVSGLEYDTLASRNVNGFGPLAQSLPRAKSHPGNFGGVYPLTPETAHLAGEPMSPYLHDHMLSAGHHELNTHISPYMGINQLRADLSRSHTVPNLTALPPQRVQHYTPPPLGSPSYVDYHQMSPVSENAALRQELARNRDRIQALEMHREQLASTFRKIDGQNMNAQQKIKTLEACINHGVPQMPQSVMDDVHVSPQVMPAENYLQEYLHLKERNRILSDAMHVIEQNLKTRTDKARRDLEGQRLQRRKAANQNIQLETAIIELTDELASLREQVEREKHQNYLQTVGANNTPENIPMEFPPENVIIQTLIRAQVEFYFSDYNLKRDKRLLDQICADRFGYLRIDAVMNLSRVRQLSSHRSLIINALKSSKFLALTTDDWVGRPHFKRPQEKQFPFRRTVYVFGLPLNAEESYVRSMLEPFGSIAKVKFDHGPDTLDRKIAQRMFESSKVYKLLSRNTFQLTYKYRKQPTLGGSKEYTCQWCGKKKTCSEGFYESNSFNAIVCLQCAAAQAERQLEKFQEQTKDLESNNAALLDLKKTYLGESPHDTFHTKTALAVFTSQRQASKCVYVRSRIAYEGCFTTHYHHYSKMKKEIALSIKHNNIKIIGLPLLDNPQSVAEDPLDVAPIPFKDLRAKSLDFAPHNTSLDEISENVGSITSKGTIEDESIELADDEIEKMIEADENAPMTEKPDMARLISAPVKAKFTYMHISRLPPPSHPSHPDLNWRNDLNRPVLSPPQGTPHHPILPIPNMPNMPIRRQVLGGKGNQVPQEIGDTKECEIIEDTNQNSTNASNSLTAPTSVLTQT